LIDPRPLDYLLQKRPITRDDEPVAVPCDIIINLTRKVLIKAAIFNASTFAAQDQAGFPA
jgi:hypothetical protein